MIRSLIALQLWYQIRQEKKTKKKKQRKGGVGSTAPPLHFAHGCWYEHTYTI